MKRAILLLATALLGTTGCHNCPRTSITVQWLFVDASGGQHGCSDSGTSVVHVFLDGVQQVDASGNGEFTCAQFPNGVILPDYPGGRHSLQIDALDQAGTLLYQDQRTITANSCGDTTLPVDLAAVQGPLDIAYAVPAGSACPPNSFVWFSLTDLTNTSSPFDVVVDGTHTPQAFPCGNPNPIPIDAPFGTYRLDFIQIVDGSGAKFQNCTPQTVSHFGSDLIQTTLAPATTVCR